MPNKHLADDLKDELGVDLAADTSRLLSEDETDSSIYVMTFGELLCKTKKERDLIVENTFLIVDEGHILIEKPQGVALLQQARYSFCTSATLGGEVGIQRIKEVIENTDCHAVECFVDAIGYLKQGPLKMEIREIDEEHQSLK